MSTRRLLFPLMILFLTFQIRLEASIELKVVRPKPGEKISFTSGNTFIVGTISPPTASVTCNGVSIEVSSDGAFLGYCPPKLLKEQSWQTIDTVVCDAVFNLKASAGTDEITQSIPVSTPRSPSSAEPAWNLFTPPITVRANADRLLGLEGDELGDLIFIPKGSCLKTIEGSTSNFVCSVQNKYQIKLKTSDATIFSTPDAGFPQPLHIHVLSDRAIQIDDSNPTLTAPVGKRFYGIQIQKSPSGKVIITPRTTLRTDGKPVDPNEPFRGLRVCLDPGHHPDPGAIGPRGFEERSSNLALGYVIAKMLQKEGAIPLLTREENPLPLNDRHDRIRELKPDLLISLHNNSVGDQIDPRIIHGTETYYLHPWSRPLAEAVHRSMVNTLGTQSIHCKKRNLLITRFPECPSILIEPEYLILPDQEKKFMDESYRQKLGQSVIEGIRTYLLELTERSSVKQNSKPATQKSQQE